VKIRTAVEEHGSGRQLMRAKIWPRASAGGTIGATLLALLAADAWWSGELEFALVLTASILAVIALGIEGTATAMSLALREVSSLVVSDRGSALEAEDKLVQADGTTEAVPIGSSLPRGEDLASPGRSQVVHQSDWVRP
jgi:hypothetical protein